MITWRDEAGGLHQGSLFAVFAALARGEAWSFPALRPHQREPWHAFTVQVAALALIRAGRDDLPGDEASWRELLVALSDGVPEAWELVVDDWSKPALLQPPLVAPANQVDYKNTLATPDALDMLVTAKAHDVKPERMAQAAAEDWLFALVTLQTMEGVMGAGNYGISRMFSGYGNRMSLGIRPSGGSGAAFKRDVRRLVAHRRAQPVDQNMKNLLWLEPWDGTRSQDIAELDPLYVEICRRIRLRTLNRRIDAVAASSKAARIAAAATGGNTGDPWIPLVLDRKAGRATFGQFVAATPSEAGFGYRQFSALLDAKRTTAPLLATLSDDDDRRDLRIQAASLVRGQGKTEGLHRRTVRTSRIEEIDGDEEPLDRIGDIAKLRSDEAGEAGKRLRRALISLVQGGPDQARLDDDAAGKKVDAWVRRFDTRVDRVFFDDALWAEVAADDLDHRLAWRERLRDLARAVFDEAAEAAPRTEMRRIRAKARAKSYLEGQMAKWLKEVA